MANGMIFPLLKLAFSMLIHQKGKTFGGLGGVGFATGLCMIQLGMRQGAMESMAVIPTHSTADIWVVSAGTVNMEFSHLLDERDYYKVLSVVGVSRAELVLVSVTHWRLGSGGKEQVEIVGTQPDATMLTPWNVIAGDTDLMHHDGGIIIDQSDLKKLDCSGLGATTEISSIHALAKRATVHGLTHGIFTFINTPIAFTGLTDARDFTGAGKTKATAILVRVEKGYDPAGVVTAINEACGPDLKAYTRDDYCAHTIRYWSDGTGVGNFFVVLAVMGVLIGFGILTLIQQMQVSDHLNEFAILKAIGAGSLKIGCLVLLQAMVLGIVGFMVGLAMVYLAQTILDATSFMISISLDGSLILGVFLGTCLFSVLASIPGLALIVRTDPETVFRN